MNTRMALSLGLSTLMMGGSIAGVSAVATATDRSGPAAEKAAWKQANKSGKALSKHQAAAAIGYAEAAVGLSPRNGNYRLLLGQAYMQAGRFASARTAFADALSLSPDDGKAALNLSLAQTATGDWAGARTTLDSYATVIPASDLGLAMALAGNPAGAVSILTVAARSPGANAKIRQNLALALALSGEWNMARVAAAADLSPADVDARIEQWAAFAQPHSASDQVAALIGVQPVADGGMPVALALNAPVQVMPAAAAPVAVVQAAPVAPIEPEPAAKPIAPVLAGVVFAPSRAVVQALPIATIRPAAAPVKVALAKPATTKVAAKAVAAPAARGDWVVQLGAYDNAGVAKDGWARVSRRYAALHGHQPTGTSFAAKQGSVYRLSVGGFVRGDADRLCRDIRGAGGACFVRKTAGDQMAQWLRKPGVQVASR